DGPMPQTLEHIVMGSQVRVPSILLGLNFGDRGGDVVLGELVGVDFCHYFLSELPVDIVIYALLLAMLKFFVVLLFDCAGRLHVDVA
ncbi:hypothetical protein LXA51_17515, partial [Erwinia amylovora]|nr:hypothetical protein [Erwinia amylovora]